MMGHSPPPQGKLFYTNLNLDKRIRPHHLLRRIARLIDFDFIYHEVADQYGTNGIARVRQCVGAPTDHLKTDAVISALQRALRA